MPAVIPILHQGDDCVAVLKPCGVASVPERAGDSDCLCALLERQLARRVLPVHRLDKDVSGVILYALTPTAHQFFCAAFERRDVFKTYFAVAHGALENDSGVISRPIREFGSGRMGVDDAKGKPSETRYEVIRRNERHTLVRLHPLTGRRHQLRVHLYSIGHSIAGDSRYGTPAQRVGEHPRLMLTSTGISLTLPSGARLDLRDVVPDDFLDVSQRVYGLAID